MTECPGCGKPYVSTDRSKPLCYLCLTQVKANEAFENKQYREAISRYDTLLAYRADSMKALRRKGIALYFINEYIEAVRCFDMVLEKNPENPVWPRYRPARISTFSLQPFPWPASVPA